MVKLNRQSGKPLTLQQLMRREVLLASVLPTTAVLVVGVVGIRQMGNTNSDLFMMVFLLCAATVFFGERMLILSMQRAIERQVTVPQQQHHTASPLDRQLKQVVREVLPALNGDLRVKVATAEDSIGLVADVYNDFIQRLVQFTRWTLYITDQITTLSRGPLDHSLALAQTLETQLQHVARTIVTLNKLTTFIQRMGSILQLSADMVQEAYASLPQEKPVHTEARTTGERRRTASGLLQSDEATKRLPVAVQKQMQLLKEVVHSTRGVEAIAASMLSDLSTLERELQQARTDLFKNHEHIEKLLMLATDWRISASSLQLPEEQP